MVIATSRADARERVAGVASCVGMRGWEKGVPKPEKKGKAIPGFDP